MATLRLPLATPFEDRELAQSGTINTDSFLINCYNETQPDGRRFVVKRPGLTSEFTYNGGGATNGQGTVFYKNSLMAMGSNVLYILSGGGNGSADGSAWTNSTAGAWAARSNFGAIVFQNQIFVMGGKNAGGIALLNDVWASSDGLNWTQVVSAAPWTKRSDFALAILGNTLYLMGGSGPIGVAFNDVWSTTDGVNWTQVVASAPWSARLGHTAVSFNQGIFLLGGNTPGTGYLNDVWFTPDGVTWTQMVTAAGWGARAFHSALVFAGNIFILGGTNGAAFADVWKSPDGITWTNTVAMPAARSQMAACVYSNRMWILTGADAAVTGTTTIWFSDFTGTGWGVGTAAYGGAGNIAPSAVVFQTPLSVSALNAPTMWLLGGDATVFTNAIWRGTLNVTLAASFTPTGTGASTTEQWQVTTQNAGGYLIWKNSVDAWVFYAGRFSKITSTNYPKITVPGIVNLDDTVYVMDADGVIYGSNLSDPFTWSALNFITADFRSDTGVCLAGVLNYVIALKSTSMQVFYDAGRYPGSPLLPAKTYNALIGCMSALSVVNIQNSLVWAARSTQYGPYIVMFDGNAPTKISTPAIDRILSGWIPSSTTDHATAIRWNGHYCYLLTLGGRGITLVYDFDEKEWWIGKSGTTGPFNVVNYVTDGSFDYFQDASLGILYLVTSNTYQDNGAVITCVVQSTMVDGGNNKRKFLGRTTVIGDRLAASPPNNLLIQWSDDDAQTFSTGVTVDLTQARPNIPRGGSFRRRRYKATHASNNPMRLEALELEVVASV